MSMIGWVQALSPAQISALRAVPSRASALAMLAEDEHMTAVSAEMVNRMRPEQREAAQAQQRAFEQSPAAKQFQARMTEARAQIEPLGRFEPALDLEKSWHMLHYLFTGHVDDSAAPGNALLTGEEIGEDVGYGPCRLHDRADTADFASFLKTLELANLQQRVNYAEMVRLQVYAMPMGGPGSDADLESELRAEVAVYFPRLRDYVSASAERQGGLLTWVS
jgi:hypothetical protein